MTVKENPNNNSFPDFVCDNGFIEHFEVTSSKTTGSGSTMKQEEALFKKSDKNHVIYSPHTHKDFLESFETIWKNHIDSLNDYKEDKDIRIFMVEYKDSSMIVDAKKSQLYNRTKPRFPQDVVYMISKDVKLLNYIFRYKNQIHYVIFVHENWMFQEVMVGEKYYCPTCNTELILKSGIERQAHFSHKVVCSDHWRYEMSEWHQRMQNYFLPKYREVVVEHNGEKHRADVLIPDRHGGKSLVIEFQHSNMSIDEFVERNVFYKNAGYDIIWVFDINNPITEKFLSDTDDYIFDFKWNCPYACLKDYKYYTNKDKLPNKVLLSYYDDGDDILFLFEQYNIFSREVDVDCTWNCGGSLSMSCMQANSVNEYVGDFTDAEYFFN